jgi:hypothetical protein
MELIWSEVYTFEQLLLCKNDLREQYAGRSGVYIHTDHRAGEVAYVGKTSGNPGLWERQYTHYANYIGCLYLIPEADSRSNEYIWKPGPDEPNNLSTVFNEGRFIEKIKSAFWYVQRVQIHLCILPSHAEAKKVERELIYAFQPHDTKKGKISEPSEEIALNHHCAKFPEIKSLLKRERQNHSFKFDSSDGPN